MSANAEHRVRGRFSYERFASTLLGHLEAAFEDSPALNRVAM